MKIQLMAKSWEGANSNNRVLLAANLLLSIALCVALLNLGSQHERIVLTPPYLDSTVKVGWNSADAEYLKSYGLYFAVLTANVTPKNVKFVTEVLSGALSSRIYPDVRKKLLTLADDPLFRTQGASVRFEPTKVVFESETSKVFVAGDMTAQNALGRNDSRPMVYEMVITMSEGKPLIDALNSYEGGEPHTLRWLDLHKNQPQKAPQEDNS